MCLSFENIASNSYAFALYSLLLLKECNIVIRVSAIVSSLRTKLSIRPRIAIEPFVFFREDFGYFKLASSKSAATRLIRILRY
jgi:hypothetical protein